MNRHLKTLDVENKNIKKYHRPISEILNTIIYAGFKIEKVVEPIPDRNDLEKRTDLIDELQQVLL